MLWPLFSLRKSRLHLLTICFSSSNLSRSVDWAFLILLRFPFTVLLFVSRKFWKVSPRPFCKGKLYCCVAYGQEAQAAMWIFQSLLFSVLFMAFPDHGPFLDSNLGKVLMITCAYHMYLAFPGSAMLVSNALCLLCSPSGSEPLDHPKSKPAHGISLHPSSLNRASS
jgi:hypothetical protein